MATKSQKQQWARDADKEDVAASREFHQKIAKDWGKKAKRAARKAKRG